MPRSAAAALRPPTPPARMTLAEFIEWHPGDHAGGLWQLVDGEPVAMAPASGRHAAIQAQVCYLLAAHLAERASPCRVGANPGVVPRARARENWRIPDVGVSCAPDSPGLDFPEPVLLVEILSPSNQAETRANIWAYTTIPSVAEILVLHTARPEAEVLRRLPGGDWPDAPEAVRAGGAVSLGSLGFSAPLAAFYRTTALAAEAAGPPGD